jgi:hypothetical protein
MATESHGTETHRMTEHDGMHEQCEMHGRFDEDGRQRREDRSLVGLMKELRDESTYLFRQEIALAKAEMGEKAAKFGRNTAYLVAGIIIAIPAVLYLTLAGLVGIYNGLVEADMTHANAGWLAPLIVAAVLGAIGATLIFKGLHAIRNEPLAPERTLDSLQDNKNWIKEKVKS